MNTRRRHAFFVVLCIVAISISTIASSNIGHAQAKKTSRVPEIVNNATVHIQPKNYPGLCLGILGASKQENVQATLWSCNSNPDQTWILNVTGVNSYGSIFQIKNQNSKLCLGLYQGTTQEGIAIQQFACNTNADQSWNYFTGASSPSTGVYNDSLINQNSFQCLGLQNGTITSGGIPIQWACNGNPDQTWLVG